MSVNICSHTVSAAASIDAAPQRVYALLADYREGHPGILPAQFSDLVVEQGGTGAGTVIRFRMRSMGKTQNFRAAVTEPEPGRVLAESYLDGNGAVTTFTVDPIREGTVSQVTISTTLPLHTGIRGAIERFFATRYLRPIYQRELQLLAARLGQREAEPAPAAR